VQEFVKALYFAGVEQGKHLNLSSEGAVCTSVLLTVIGEQALQVCRKSNLVELSITKPGLQAHPSPMPIV
jgi:hypothetical protein